LKEDILEVTIPTSEGEITILPHHTPLIAFLKPGVLVLKKSNGEEEVAFVAGGFLEVLRNKVVVLADTAERASEIDEKKVIVARERAEKLMSETRTIDAEQFALISGQLEKELARGRALKRWKNVKR